jgi:hypothetical protein
MITIFDVPNILIKNNKYFKNVIRLTLYFTSEEKVILHQSSGNFSLIILV